MPSFDIVSEIDLHEVSNAVDQANREVGQRFDFKGSEAKYSLDEATVTLAAESEFQLQQMLDILKLRLAKRKIDLAALEIGETEQSNRRASQKVIIRQGIDTETARRLVKEIKAAKLKVQAQIQGEQVRVSGKKRDDLQKTISQLQATDYGLPLQYVNFRD